MLAIYEATVYPLPRQSIWCIPNAIKDMVVLPPKGRIRAGRPKKIRFKNPCETKSKISAEDVDNMDIIHRHVEIHQKCSEI